MAQSLSMGWDLKSGRVFCFCRLQSMSDEQKKAEQEAFTYICASEAGNIN
jgi:hypothetical protein